MRLDMAPSSGELWGHNFMPVSVELMVLLPTGQVVMVSASRDQELKEVKRLVVRQLDKEPPILPLDLDRLVLKGVRNDGEFEEFYDETRLLCDLRLFQPILMLQEPQGNRAENMLNTEIGHCINLSLSDLASMSKLEAHIFRQRFLLPVAQYSVERLKRSGKDGLLRYLSMAELLTRFSRPVLAWMELNDVLAVEMLWQTSNSGIVGSTVQQPTTTTSVAAYIIEGLRMIARVAASELHSNDPVDYALKVCCSDQYLLDQNSPLLYYRYVQECVETGERPRLLLVRRSDLLRRLPPDDALDFIWPSDAGERFQLRAPMPSQSLKPLQGDPSFPPMTSATLNEPLEIINSDGVLSRHYPMGGACGSLNTPGATSGGGSSTGSVSGVAGPSDRRCLWDVTENFSIHVVCVSGVRTRDNTQLMVRMRIHHGNKLLCPPMDTPLAEIRKPQWNDWVTFDLAICNIPHGARLTMTLLQVIRRQQKKAHQEVPLGWTQLSLLDFRGFLRSDRRLHLNLAAPTAGGHDEVQQLITPTRNELSLSMAVEFPNFSTYLQYPEPESPLWADVKRAFLQDREACARQTPCVDRQKHDAIMEIMGRDLMSELSDQECAMLWSLRHLLGEKYKRILPRMVEAVPWHDRHKVGIFYEILKKWSLVPSLVALQLIGTDSADPRVRQFGVVSLHEFMNIGDLQHYVLQLSQMLKLEPYLDNTLTRFLLYHALENAQLGEKFFWYLRSEMHDREVQLRYGLILEAYCRGCGPVRRILAQQCAALDKLTFLSDHIKQQKEEEQIKIFHEKLGQLDIRRCISNFVSPLDISQTLGELEESKCDIKKSKKRPLWLVWRNPDPLAKKHFSDYKIIFKHGDDLRQDMLTLQMLRLMDSIWKQEGFDLKLIPYGCLATGQATGVIEAVRNASTVMTIQKKAMAAALQMSPGQIHRWLLSYYGNNPESADFKRAVSVFRDSCAGYCVATFVLGVRDRHPDNIMVSKSGQLFHIDFGHFLNNRKKKFGINRERVPFVLTKDFIYVISKGRGTGSRDFDQFAELCCNAYKVLRAYADLFLTLFSMMTHCGIPELQSVGDIEYIRKSLAVELTEEEALKYFRRQLEEAAANAWKTEVDWFIHFLKN